MILWTNLKVVKNIIQKQELISSSHEMLCAIWYHLYNFKNIKNTRGEVLLLAKLQALVYECFPRF